MKKSKKIILILLIGLSVLYIGVYYKIVFHNNTTVTYSVQVYKIDEGYGYMILDNTKILIKQDHIPSLEKHQLFCNYEDAKKVGTIVAKRLYNKKNPSINKNDLKELSIKLECN
ncbi:MAG: DUF4907 domain-containing protein [Flavobacteriaceae bacterium]|nr:DUF4907 domain-containing protein [Flavobacteriaceae bacterium]